jgi:hypothetical protein
LLHGAVKALVATFDARVSWKKLSMRSSCKVISCGVPNVAEASFDV